MSAKVASTRRTSFHFSKEAMAQLDAIRARTHYEDNPEIIRAALQAYEELIDLAARGCHMFIRSHEGGTWPYSPYIKLSYPGLKRDEINAEAAAAAEKAEPTSYFFSGDFVDRLEAMKKRSRSGSNADAIRLALSAYKELVLVNQAGDMVLVRDAEGVEHLYSPFQPFTLPSTAIAAE